MATNITERQKNIVIFLTVTVCTLWMLYWYSNPKIKISARIFKSEAKNRKLDAYKQLHEDIVRGKRPMRVVIHAFDGAGYGNMVHSLLSSFAIAISTDRAFVLGTHRFHFNHLAAYMDGPLGNETFRNYTDQQSLLSLDYKNDSSTNYLSMGHWNRIFSVIQKEKHISTFINLRLPMKPRIITSFAHAHFLAICSIPVYHEKLYDYGFVSRSTIDAAREALNSTTITESQRLNTVLRVGFEYANTFLNQYWLPKVFKLFVSFG